VPLRAALQLTAGTLAGLPARADLQASLGAVRVADARAEIALGRSRLEARGGLGAPGDRLEFSVALDSLAQVATLAGLPALEGAAGASGSLQGRLDAPAVRARGRLAAFAFGDSVRARAATWSIDLPSFAGAPEAARLELRADADGLEVGDLRWSRVGVSASGSLRAHEVAGTVQAPAYALSLRAAGGVAADGRWAGTLRALETTGSLDVRLLDPVRVEWGGGAASVGPAELRSRFGSLRLERAGWRDGRFDVAGEATLQRLAGLAQALGVTLPPEAWPARLDELQLAARADLAGSSTADLSGTLAVRLRGTNGDTARGDADLALQSGALSGSVDLRVPTLAFANRLVGPEWALDGRLRVSAQVGGRVAEPRLQGTVTGEALRMEQRAMGWRLGDGTLAGRFDGDRFRVDSLRLAGLGPRGGSVELAGDIGLADRSGAFRLSADKLLVPIGPGQKVILSGSAEATGREGRFDLRGSLRADEGLIELRGGEAPSLPEDVVVVGRDAAGVGKGARSARRNGEAAKEGAAKGEPSKGDAAAFGIASDVTLDLGDNLRVRGSGLDARLTGSLKLRGTLPDAPRAFGTVRVRDGRSSAATSSSTERSTTRCSTSSRCAATSRWKPASR
jgi:translocation and assembly module TamB